MNYFSVGRKPNGDSHSNRCHLPAVLNRGDLTPAKFDDHDEYRIVITLVITVINVERVEFKEKKKNKKKALTSFYRIL